MNTRKLDAIPELPTVLTQVTIVSVQIILPEEDVETVFQTSFRRSYQALQIAEYVTARASHSRESRLRL